MEGEEVKNMEIPDSPPPEYETVINLPRFEDIPDAPEYETPSVQGFVGDFWKTDPSLASPSSPVDHLPRLGFADFLPRLITPGNVTNNILPTYDDFKSVIVTLNDWLKTNPQYLVIRAESLERKVDTRGSLLESDTTIYHESAFGKMQYVRGIRVWLVPNTEKRPAQQLWYVNIVPKIKFEPLLVRSGGMVMPVVTVGYGRGYYARPMGMPSFESLDCMVKKLNEKMASEPLPGSILTVESIDMKYFDYSDPSKFDPDVGFFFESQGQSKLYLTTLRVYFVRGPPKQQVIGIEDFCPAMTYIPKGMGKPRFEGFSQVIERASQWLAKQQGVRATNMQAVNTKVNSSIFSNLTGNVSLNSKETYHMSGSFETMFVKCLRIPYIKEEGSRPTSLFSRDFVPVRIGRKSSETMSQTVQRVNAWINCTGANVIGVDSIAMEFSPENRSAVDTDKTRHIFMGRQGHYWISCLRLYIEGAFCEPPPEVFPPIPAFIDSQTSSACCTIL